MMDEFLQAIANFGFPIVVASYLLLRMEKTINGLSCEIRDLKDSVEKLIDKITNN